MQTIGEKNRSLQGLVIVLASLGSGAVIGEDLGSVGPTYPIAEPHLVRFIEEQFREKERTGELARIQKAIVERNVSRIRNPKPVDGLEPTAFPRTYYFDPTYVLDESLFDGNGQLVFPAGTAANPLEVVGLSKHLLFFDARDERQVRKAEELIQLYQGQVKPILVGGSFLDLMKRWKVQVFYDQKGSLSGRLGLRQVPALVSQDGRRLRIDELAL